MMLWLVWVLSVSTESKTEMLTMAPPKFDKCFVAQVRQFLDPLYANVATMLLQTSCSENIGKRMV